jgi:mannonate dehydratase
MKKARDASEQKRELMTNDLEYQEHRKRYKRDLEYFATPGNKLSRRALGKLALGGMTAAATLGNMRALNAAANDILEDGKGVKLMHRPLGNSTNPSADDLKFIKEIGFKYCYASGGAGGGGSRTFLSADEQKAAKKRYADAGLVLHNIRYMVGGPGNYALNSLLLNLPDRAQGTEHLKQFIRATGKNGAGFDYTGGRLMITGVWSSGEADIRNGTMSRRFDPTSPEARASDFLGGNKPGATRPAGGLKTLYWGREYKYDEVMDNFKKYFVKDIVPVLEEEGVFIAFHGPDDPPVFENLGGVARILSNYERIKNMFAAANSPNVGIQFCAGSWNEGGPLMGKDILEALREFAALKKYREIHYRNVSSPPVNGMPNFHEAFMDAGYYDYYKIMKTVVDIGWDGLVHLDHAVEMVGAPYTYPAYAAGFMHAMLNRAKNSPKGQLT